MLRRFTAWLGRNASARRERSAVVEEVEPRILYSADLNPALWAADAAAQSSVMVGAVNPGPQTTAAAAEQQQQRRHEIVFVDAAVPDAQTLIDGVLAARPVGTEIEVVQLSTGADGLKQIGDVLSAERDLDAIHIISHGGAGQLQLGNTSVDAAMLQSRGAELQGWRAALTADADLLLYGCDVAADAAGREFVQHMAALTGADVAASDDTTGHETLGGDWQLEATTGAIESGSVFSDAFRSQWVELLPIATLQASGDTYIMLKSPDDANNFGAATSLIIDRESGDLQRALLQFDLSSIPANATINSATLKMQATDVGGTLNIDVYEMLQSWVEGTGNGTAGTANWNQRAPSTNWTTAGGTFNSTAAATLNTGSTGQHTWSLTALVQAWVNGSKVNNGVMVASPDGGGNRTATYDSSEGTTPPVLVIDYTATGAPTISGLAGDSLSYTAGGGPIVIEQGGNTAITDANSPDFNTGTLTVSFVAGSDSAEDVLAIRNQGTGAGQIGVSGSNVTYAGTTIGTFTGGSGGANLVVTLNANANATNTAALIQNITFQDTDSSAPTTGTRTVRFVLTDGDGGTSAGYDTTVTLGAVSQSAALWVSSNTVATSSGGSGGLSWTDGQVVKFGDPNLALGSGTTAGTFSSVFDIDSFASDGNASLSGLHQVSRSVVVGSGGGSFTLQAGDVLLAVEANETLGGVAVTKNDIVLFRPTTPGNYSAGSFSILLQNPTTKAVADFTLAEQSTVVGGSTLQAGSFLIGEPGKNDVYRFVPTSTGAGATSGTLTAQFIAGADINIGQGFAGLELIQAPITLGGVSLSAGQLLVSLAGNDSTVGDNNLSVLRYDVFVLTLSSTGAGTTAGTAANLLTGADVGISAGGEEFDALALVGVNQAPVLSGANNLTSIAEDPSSNPGTLVSALISGQVTDGDTGALSGIAVTGVVNTNGAWQWSANGGLDWNAFGSPSTAAARLLIADSQTYVRFVPNADWNGTVSNGITFRAWDQTTGTAGLTANTTTNGGSTAFSSATASSSITVTAVNDAPSATNLSAAETYTEDTALNLTDIVISDIDSANVTATLTLSNVAAGSLNTGTSGAVTSTYNAGTGVWTASGAIANVNALLAGLTFTPAANFNSNFNIATSVSDGVAAPVTGSKAMTGTAVNDAPGATNLSAAETYTEDTALNLTDIVISDVDSANVTATLTLSNTAAGSLNTGTSGAVTSTYNAGTGVWSASGAIANVNALLAGLNFTPTANFNSNFTIATSVSDGVAAPVTGSKAMTGTAVNDAPGASNLSAGETYTEDTALNLTDIVVSDVDSANVTATLTLSNTAAGSLNTGTSGAVTSTYNAGTGVWTASGAIADVNTLLAGLTFTPAANFNSNFTIATSVSDGVAAPVTGSKAMTGTAVNDAPGASNLSAGETYTEDTARNLTDIVISDVDSANVTATVTLSNTAAGSLNTGTSGAVTSIYNAGTGVWTASGAIADVNVLLAGLTFTPASNFNSNFTIATSVSDGVAAPVTGSKAMTGTAVNDAPGASNLSAGETYTEDTALNLTDIVVSDVDSANVTATLTLSNTAAGSLNTGTSGVVTSTYNAGTGVWNASGAIANVNALLAGLTFTPAANFNTNFTIATSVSDGVAAPVTGSKAVTGTAVNDTPVVTTTGSTLAYTENGAATAVDSALTVSDVDSANLASATVTISAGFASAEDTLAFTNQNGITGSWNAGTGVLTLSGSATVANYQTALRSITYVNTSDNPSTTTRTVSFVVNDGSANSNTGTRNISITAVNDAPVLDNTGSMALANVGQDNTNPPGTTVAAMIASAGGNRITDVDSGAVEGIAITARDNSNGTWQYSTNGGVNWTAVGNVNNSQALVLSDTPNDMLRFVPAAGFSGNATITFRAWDRSDALASGTSGVSTSSNGGSTPFSSATEVGSVYVEPLQVLLWVSTSGDVSGSGVPGLSNWTESTVLTLGDPGLSLGAGSTGGRMAAIANFDNFGTDVEITGLHHVNQPVTLTGAGIAGGALSLLKGDMLFVTGANESLSTAAGSPPAGWANNISTTAGSVYVFRPAVGGNYGSGYFHLVMAGPGPNQTTEIALVETATTVGGTALAAGDLLFTQTGNIQQNNIYWYRTGTNTTNLLVDGADISIPGGGGGAAIDSLDLVQSNFTAGGFTFQAGDIIAGFNKQVNNVGSGGSTVTAYAQDLVRLRLSATTYGAGTAVAAAMTMFDGDGNAKLDTANENVDAVSLLVLGTSPNVAPVVALPGGALAYTENAGAVIVDATATVSDFDSPDLDTGVLRVDLTVNGSPDDRLAIRNQGNGAGQIGVAGSDVSYGGVLIGTFAGGTDGSTPLFVTLNASATPAAVQALLRNITYANVSNNPSSAPRTLRVLLSDGDGATSTAVGKTINVTNVNDPPAAVNDAYSVDEDTTLVVAPSTANLANWWRLDDGGASQTVADAGALGNSATRGSSGAAESTDPAWTTGYVGGAGLSFDGSSDFVSTNSTVAKTASNFTLSAWFQADTTTGQHHILWQGYAGGNGFGDPVATPAQSEMNLSVGSYNQDNRIVFFLGYNVPANGADPIYIVSASDFTDTTAWHHVAVTVADLGGGVMQAWLYVDGILEGTDTGVENDRSAWGPLLIGKPDANTRYFDGKIDEVRVYDTALSAGAVQGLAKAGVLGNDTDTDGATLKVNTAVVTGPANGTLSINADGSFTYTPNANFYGTDSFTYRANDGTVDSNVATVTITVNPVNDAPVLGTSGSTLGYTEDGAAVAVDAALTLSDIDNASLSSATVSVSSAFASGEDTLAFTNQSGITGSWNAGTGALTLTGIASVAQYQAALRSITYVNTSNNPSTATRTVSFVASDDTNSSNTGTRNIAVTAVNDAPGASNLSAGETYTEDTPLNLIDIVVSDADSANVTGTLTLSNTAAGSLNTGTSGAVTSTYNAGTGVWTASGAVADVNTLLAALTFTPAANFNSNFTIATSVSDGVAAPVTGSKAMTGTAVNDAPSATNLSAGETYTEDTPLNLTDIVISDVDSANVTATLTLSNTAAGSLNTGTSGAVTSTYNAGTGVWIASGAIANVNALLAGLTFTPAANFNSNFNIATSVSDGVAAPVTGSKAMTGTAVNDAPGASNLSAGETYTEDTALNLTDIVVSDVDSANVTATLTLSDTAAGGLNTGTSGAVTSTYNAGTGVWTASGAVADVNALLAGLTFTPAANFNSNFTISTSVSDGVAAPVTGSKAMTGTAVNDAPSATNLSAAETYTEDTPLNLTDIVVSDVDSANVTATLTLSNTAAGSLNTATSGAVTSTYNAGTGVWTASGAVADVNTLLAGLTFAPAVNFNSNFTIVTSLSDAIAAPVTGTKAMTGTAVNDAPTATNLSATETYAQDTPLNLTDIVISDVDSANVTATLTLSNTAAGGLNTGTSGAVTSTYNAGTGVWTASGAIADVNALLAGLTFTPAASFNSNFTISTSVSDGVAAPVTGSKAFSTASGMAIWTNNTGNPQHAQWIGSGFGATTAPNALGEWTHIQAAEAPTRTEIIAVGVDSAGVMRGEMWNGSTWTAFSFNTIVDLSTTGYQSFQIAYEQQSGDAMLVWDNGTTGSASLSYRTWNGTAWSAAQTITTPVSGEAVQMRLAADPNSDSMILAVTGTPVENDYALVWNGSSWGNSVTLDTGTGIDGTEIHVAYEAHSGQALVVYDADGTTNALNYRTWDGTSWSAQQSLSAPAGVAAGSDASYAVLVSDPNSNRIALGVVGEPEIWLAVWDGSAWTSTLTATASAGSTTDLNVALGFEHDSGDLLAAYGKNGSNYVAYRTWTSGGGWSAETASDANLNLGATPGALALFADPNSNQLMLGTRDSGNDVRYALWTGSAWSAALADSTGDVGGAYATPMAFVWYHNNRTPVIGTTGLSMAENSTLAGSVASSDADGDARSYAIVGGADQALFTIDSGTGALSFVSAPNYESPTDAGANNVYNVIVQVADGKGGTDSESIAVSVTNVNEAPVATNLSAAETYTEDTALNLTDVVISDVDSANVTATLTLSNAAAGSLNTGTSGAVTSTYNAGTGVWTASGAIANVNALLAGLTFTPAGNFNSNFTIATSVSDGVAAPVTGTKTMTGTAVNDAPSATNLSAAETYTEDTALNLTDIVISDVDSASVTATLTLSNTAAGSLNTGTSGAVTSTYNAGTGVWTASGTITDVNTLLAGLTFTPAANFNSNFTIATSVSDGVAAPVTGSKAMTGTPVNDAPSATNLSTAETYTEDTALNLIDIVISDVDSANVTATLTLSNTAAGSLNTGTSGSVTSTFNAGTGVWTASGAIADVNALLAGLTFSPAANFNSSFTIATSVSDGVAAPVTGNKAMTGTPVNDAPSASNLGAAETYTEETALNLTDIVISDVDSASVTATLTLSSAAAGSLNTGTSGAVTSTYNAGTGVWMASGAIADVNTLLAGLTFTPAANFNSNFTISTSVSDGVAAPVTGSKTMTGTAVNDAPVVGTTGSTLAYTENGAATVVDAALSLSDVDNANLSSATITISAGFASAEDTLAFTDQNGISGSWNSGTGVLTLTGSASVANYQTALRSISYVNSSDNPNTTTRTVSFVVNDGSANSNTGTRNISITAVNDAPVITSNGGGASASISVAENGTAVTTATSSDVDGGAPAYSILAGGDGAKFTINAGTGVLTFVTAPDHENPSDLGADNVYNLTLQVSDGSGGTDTQAIAVTVTDVADGIRVTPISVAPIGAETRVNTNTGDFQTINPNVAQAIATDAAGNFVVVWSSNLQDGDSYGIYAQRYSADGTPQGVEFRVNTTTADNQNTAVVAMDAAGNFVVAWASNLQDGSGYGVYAQRYNAAGVAQGSEFLVNSTTAAGQTTPSIAMSAGGAFVITWTSGGQDPDASSGIYAQRFDASGVAQGGEFRVNTYTTNTQQLTSVGMDAAGNFVVIWASLNQDDGASYGVYGQRYNAAGVAQGAEFRVNTTIADSQLYHDVAMLADGRFAVVFQSRGAGPSYEVYVQRYAADGSALGGEIRVNTTTVTTYQPIPSISADASGNLTVVWRSPADGAGDGVIGRRLDWSGTPLGAEFQVNSTTAGDQGYPEVVSQPGGGFVVAWSGNGPGDADGVFFQRYGLTTTEAGGTATFSVVLEAAPTGDVVISVSVLDGSEGSVVVGSLTFTTANWNIAQIVTVTGVQDYSNDGNTLYTVVLGSATSSDANFNGLNPADVSVVNLEVPNVAPVNTVPGAQTVNEDTALVFSSANGNAITLGDADAGSNPLQVTLSVTNGALTLGGVAGLSFSAGANGSATMTFSGTIASINTALNGLRFDPTSNYNGSALLTLNTNDQGNSGTGGAQADNDTVAISVDPVNDAPSASNLSAAETYTEDTALNLTDIVISDVDSASVTATLTLSNTAAGSLNTGTSGAVTSTYNAGTGVWIASGAIADVNTLLAALTFTPAADFNSSFTIATSVSDGAAAPVIGSKVMTGTAVNDAPSATNLSTAETYTEDTALNLTDIVISDIDSANVTATLTLSNTAAGSLNTGTSGAVTSTYNAGTGVWTASGAIADVNALLAGLTFTPAANFDSNFTIATSVSDGVAPALTGSKAISATAVNDAPVVTTSGSNLAYTENAAATAVDGGLTLSDVDSANLAGATVSISAGFQSAEDTLGFTDQNGITGSWNSTSGVLTLSGSATMVQYQAALRSITYVNGSDNPSTTNRTVSFVVNDGAANSNTGTRDITVAAVNDAPLLGPAGSANTIAENSGAFLLAAPATVSDVDSLDFDGGQLVVAISANGLAEDRLTIRDEGSGAGQVGVSGTDVRYGGVLVGSFNGPVSGSASLIVTFNANADAAVVQAVVRNLTYENLSEAPSAAVRTIQGYVTDGDGGTSVTVSGTLAVTPVNDAPTLGNGVLGAVAEDSANPAGQSVATIFAGQFADVDAGASLSGLAVVGNSANAGTQGSWQYSSDAGAHWHAIGAVADGAGALALSNSTLIRFLPVADYHGTPPALTVRGLDDSYAGAYSASGVSETRVTIDTGSNGGTTPIAAATSSVSTSVSPVNDAPTTSPVTLASIAEDSGARLITQAELLANASDVDGPSLTATGLAISAGNGALTDNGDGTWTYTPVANDDASVSFSYSVSDGTASVAGSATLDITPVNDAPTTTPVTLVPIAEDSGARLITQAELLANASDVDGPSLTATGLTISSGSGSLLDNGNGTWSYTPASNDDTSVSFSYTITDGTASVAGSATLDITPVNDAPSTTPVTLAPIAEDGGARLITQAELLANASDVDGPGLTATGLAISAGNGALIDNGNGTWSYTPAANDDASVSFSYTVTDGSGSVAGSATLDITPVNDAPTSTPVTLASIAEDSGARLITQAELLANATDVDGPGLTVTGLAISAGNGALVDNGDGTWTYTPAANDDTSVSFGYTITDGTATVAGSATLDIAPVNDAPITTPVTLAPIAEDSGARLITQAELLANASDVDGPSLTATGLTISAGIGALIDNGNGTWTYTPAANDDASVTFSYTVSDGAASAVGSATLDITPINDAPTTTPVTLAPIAEDSGARLITQAELLANANDVDGPSLSATGLSISAGSGALLDNGDGTWTYTPAANDDASVSFSYIVTDGTASAAGSATLDIVPVNDAPTTTPVTLAPIAEDSGARLITQAELLANAGDVDGPSLTATGLAISAGNGALTDNGDGTWTYTPVTNDDASVSFSYSVSDGSASVAGSATLDITPVNDAPTTTLVTLAPIAEDSGARLITQAELLANASDVDGPALTATGLAISGGSGSLIDNGDGTWTYTPAANDDASVSFSYTVTDGSASVAGSATLDVTPVNDAPTTTPVTLAPIAEDSGPRLITQTELLANASDVDGPGLTATGLTISAGNGTLTDNGDGTWTYTPAGNDDTAVSFSYTITDGGASVAGSATLDITPVNDAPTTTPVTLAPIGEDSGARLITQAELLANASDVDGPSLTATGLTIAAGSGSLVDNGNGTWTFTPAANDATSVSFSYNVTDGTASAAGSATLDITPINDAPTATPVTLAPVAEDSSARVITQAELLATATDVDGPSLTATGLAISAGSGGLIDNGDGTWSYTPAANDDTTVSFTYTVTDGAATTAGSATLDTTPVNDAPTTTPVALAPIAEDSGARLITQAELLANASDIDGPSLTATGLAISAGGGSLINNGDGTWSYTPAANDDASVSFSYSVTDGTASVAGSATLDITPVNDAPTTTPVTLVPIAEDSGARLITQAELLANASDVDGAVLTVTGLVSGAGSGTLIDNGNGTWTYTAAPNDDTSVSFSYNVTDGTASAAGSATLDITPVNDAPTTTPVTLAPIAEDSGARLITQAELLANASDVDGPSLTATGLAIIGGSGALIDNGNGTWTYTPASNDDAAVSFSYVVSDGAAAVAGSASMDLLPAGDAPVITSNGGAAGASVSVGENGIAVTTVTATDADAAASPLAYTISGGADAARFTLDAATGALRFIAAPDFEAPADANADNVYDVVVQASDGVLADTQAIAVTVGNVNEAPSALTPALALADENAPAGTLVATVSAADPDAGELFSYALVNDGAGRFAIDATSGRIAVAPGALLDFESQAGFDLILRVTDAGGLTYEQALRIDLRDLPETAQPPAPAPAPAPAAAPPASAPAAEPPPPSPLPTAVQSAVAEAAALPTEKSADIGRTRAPSPGPAAAETNPSGLGQPGAAGDAGDEARRGSDTASQRLHLRVRDGAEGLVASVSFDGINFDETLPTLSVWDEAKGSIGSLLRNAALRSALIDADTEHTQAGDERRTPETLTEMLQDPVRVASVTFTAGFIWWLTRSGGLLTTMLMGVPAWRHVDLLPVLARPADDEDDDAEQKPGTDLETSPAGFDDSAVAELFSPEANARRPLASPRGAG